MEAELQELVGAWVLTNHWRGLIVQIAKVTPKRLSLIGGGYIEPSRVKAVFATEEDAEAGLRRYRAAWAASQDELKVFASGREVATRAYFDAERRLRDAAWSAAQLSREEGQ